MAHGHAITKMCEAFGRQGLDVELWFPCQRDPEFAHVDMYEYYNVTRQFRTRALGCDGFLPQTFQIRLNRVLSDPYKWGVGAAFLARVRSADLYLTRSVEIAFWLIRMRLPTLFEIHQPLPRHGERLLSAIARRRSMRGVIGVTTHLGDYVVSLGVPSTKVLVRPSGVDLSRFVPVRDRTECRRQLGLPLDRPIIGYVGRFRTRDPLTGEEFEKGVPVLLHTLAILRTLSDRQPVLLCVGGPSQAIDAYKALARELELPGDSYRFEGKVPPPLVPTWIRACDVVTVPWNRWDYSQSPLKLFEYMAAEVPVVAADLPALQQQLDHGRNALVVPSGDVRAMAESIQRLLENPALGRALSTQAAEDVRKYTWDERVKAICRFAGLHSDSVDG
jgi:glycosyltransferase involved in cell wall biosynthesis